MLHNKFHIISWNMIYDENNARVWALLWDQQQTKIDMTLYDSTFSTHDWVPLRRNQLFLMMA